VTKIFFRIYIRGQNDWLDYALPDNQQDLPLPVFIQNIRRDGFVLTEHIYVSVQDISHILRMQMEASQTGTFTPRIVN